MTARLSSWEKSRQQIQPLRYRRRLFHDRQVGVSSQPKHLNLFRQNAQINVSGISRAADGARDSCSPVQLLSTCYTASVPVEIAAFYRAQVAVL